jgi:NAD(P)H dehydrogenase (quinone)
MYGHVKIIAEAEKAGLKKAGIDADIFQCVLSHTPFNTI